MYGIILTNHRALFLFKECRVISPPTMLQPPPAELQQITLKIVHTQNCSDYNLDSQNPRESTGLTAYF